MTEGFACTRCGKSAAGAEEKWYIGIVVPDIPAAYIRPWKNGIGIEEFAHLCGLRCAQVWIDGALTGLQTNRVGNDT